MQIQAFFLAMLALFTDFFQRLGAILASLTGGTALLIAGCLCLPLNAGCLKFKTSNSGEWSFFWGTQIGIKTTAAKTSQDPADDGTAVVASEMPAIINWLFPEPEPNMTPDPRANPQ